ncbi:MAG: hypothetical protein QW520_03520 [Methanomassiliicoccales archaeon]
MKAIHDAIMDICLTLSEDGEEEARKVLKRECPFNRRAVIKIPKCHCSPQDRKAVAMNIWRGDLTLKMKVFSRDGFINRFTGEPVIFPAVLRLLSEKFSMDFPFHEFWAEGEMHQAYYLTGACTALIIPQSRGGESNESNMLTTTFPFVLARSDLTPDEAGWRMTREGFVDEWDGMSSWYVDYVKENPDWRKINFFNLWYNAARQTLKL